MASPLVQDEAKDLLELFYEAGVYKLGDFTLKSGQYTPVYIDLRSLISQPPLFRRCVSELWQLMKTKTAAFQCIVGVPHAAVPLATGVMMSNGVPMLLQRKEAKAYGTKKLVEGCFTAGDRCLIVEDVTVLGWSIQETANVLRAQGLIVTDAVTLVERQQGAVENLRSSGITLHSVISLDSILKYLAEKKTITLEEAKGIQTTLADTSYMNGHGVKNGVGS